MRFTDQSTGKITSRVWDFGDGSNSTETNPVHGYTQPGTYTVSLTVSGPDGSSPYTRGNYITVTNKTYPVRATFGANATSGKIPLSVQFFDASSGPVSTWFWDFGDGTNSTERRPLHQYSLEGKYTVSLTVTGPDNNSTMTKPDFITAFQGIDPVKANFTANTTSGAAPLPVQFTDLSTGSPTGFYWDFGDGSSSILQNPVHTYERAGNFSVRLNVMKTGSSAVEYRQGYIKVQPRPEPVKAAFTANETEGAIPLGVAFEDLSTGPVSTWFWDFGDGSNATLQDPQHRYGTPGLYNVSLTVTGPYGNDTLVRPGYINASLPLPPLKANFTADPSRGPAPLGVQFTDYSTGDVKSWLWEFGDQSQSTSRSPVHTYEKQGTYTVRLTITGSRGTDTMTRAGYIQVSAPIQPVKANFAGNTTTGTAPLAVKFFDRSTGSPASWFWDFGDNATSTVQNPVHEYSGPGSYSVSLTAGNSLGNNTLLIPNYITANEPPKPVKADFNATPTAGATPLDVQFTDLSSGDVTGWSWDFGDGNHSSVRNPLHTYSRQGTYSVILRVTGTGGSSDSLTKPGYVTTYTRPDANFTGEPRFGDVPLPVTFTDASSGTVQSWTWDFGDGNSTDLENPVHTYYTPGIYSVTLTVRGPGGESTVTRTAYIIAGSVPEPVQAEFTANTTSGNVPLPVRFEDLSTGTISSWSWSFGDGTTSAEQSPVHTYVAAGNYTVKLSISGPGGSASAEKEGYIKAGAGPQPVYAGFTANTTKGAAPLPVRFIDASMGTVTSWLWSFGDGSSSATQNPEHLYTSAGNYTVSLTASGPVNNDTTTSANFISVTQSPARPVAAFIANLTGGNAPLPVQFTDQSTGSVTSWSWDFGDGTTSAARNPEKTYTETGSYNVSLQVSGPGGSDSMVRAGYIVVGQVINPPKAQFTANVTDGVIPLPVRFNDESTGAISSYRWDFGDGAQSSEQNPVHVYTRVGTYNVKLLVTGPGGEDNLTRPGYITARETPLPVNASFSANITAGDAPLNVGFMDQSTGPVSAWSWSFGDGGSSAEPSPAHTYTSPGTFSVSLSVSGGGGSSSVTRTDYINVSQPVQPVAAKFSGSPTEGTAPVEVAFTDLSTGPVNQWIWTFGDGGTSTLQNPVHTYREQGEYTVTLTVFGPGSKDTRQVQDYITVKPPRTGSISVSSIPVGAAVFIDDTEAGFTPVTATGVVEGVHNVILVHEGFADYEKLVDVRYMQTTNMGRIVMTPISSQAGTIQVSSIPSGATVYLDGDESGMTPVSIRNVPSGNHEVTLRLPGYDDWTKEVKVIAGTTVRVTKFFPRLAVESVQ